MNGTADCLRHWINVSDDLTRIFCANEIGVLEEEGCIFLVTFTLALVGASNGKRLLIPVLRNWAHFYFLTLLLMK